MERPKRTTTETVDFFHGRVSLISNLFTYLYSRHNGVYLVLCRLLINGGYLTRILSVSPVGGTTICRPEVQIDTKLETVICYLLGLGEKH